MSTRTPGHVGQEAQHATSIMTSDSNDSSYSSSSSAPQTRPNRWQGPPSTWQSLTEQERGLATSLNLLRNQDLGIHLYNAFALRKRAQKVDLEAGRGLDQFSEEEGYHWKPPKSWTAWPLKPDRVPRPGEKVGPDDPADLYAFKRHENVRPSRELEDIMVGLTLKHAKEKFDGRDADRVKGEMENQIMNEESAIGNSVVQDPLQDTWGFDIDPENLEQALKKDPSLAPQSTFFRPVVSADDERSRRLLRPSIRHTLSKIDEVLEALHHMRKTCHDYGYQSDLNSEDEAQEVAHRRGRRGVSLGRRSISQGARGVSQGARSVSRASSVGSGKGRGRPRKFANLTSRPKVADFGIPHEAKPYRSKSTHRGRPLKLYEPLLDETQEEFLIRIARLQKKPLPAYAQPLIPEPSPSPEDEQPKRHFTRRARSEELSRSRQRKLGLRDWSEVLGAAAVVGFPPDVIARASQRCAGLFGESIMMRTMRETSYRDKNSFSSTTYKPDEIQDFSAEQLNDSSGSSDTGLEEAVHFTANFKRFKNRTCPIDGCPRSDVGFRDMDSLRRHLRKGHKMTDDELADVLEKRLIQAQDQMQPRSRSNSLDGDQEMQGAVHVDNYMMAVKHKAKRKRSDTEEKGRSGLGKALNLGSAFRDSASRVEESSNSSSGADDFNAT